MYQKIVTKFNNISFAIVAGLCALLPIIFLPATIGGGAMVKGFILYIGVFVAVSIWLIGQFIVGSVKFPKSPALLALGVWSVLSLISAFTAVNPAISLWGKGFVFDSFSTTLVLSLFVFMVATFARDQKRLVKLFLVTFSGAAITVFLQFILYVSQRVPFVSKYLGHVANQGTLVGSWVDFTYFVTFVFLLALLMYEVLIPKGIFKVLSFTTMVISLVALVFLNFKTAWIVTIISSLVVFVYKSSVERSLNSRLVEIPESEPLKEEKSQFPLMSLISLLVGLFFFLSSATIGAFISRSVGVSFSDVRPSFSTTTTVMRQALYKDPILGSGAGGYSSMWNQYHPTAINSTVFWNSPFDSGSNLIQSLVTTNGILPVLALIAVLVFSLIHGFKLFNYKFPDRFTRFIAVSSLIMTLALTILFFFASPGIVLVMFGFIYIGLLFGVSSLLGKTRVVSIDYLKDPRMSFFAILILVVSSMVGFSAVYFTGNKFASIIYYNKALTSADFPSAQVNIDKAIGLSQNDIYFRARTSLFVNQFNTLASKESPDKTELQTLFTQAEQSAQAAVALDKSSADNWLALSQVYQLIADSTNAEAIKNIKDSAFEAQKRNPNNPLYAINNARIALIEKNTTLALEEIEKAIVLKPDYLEAFILRGQIKQSQGESQAIKNELVKYTTIAPFDSQGFILLGNVYLEAKNYSLALEAFARLKILAPNDPNSYIPYIQTLEASGDRTKSVEELKSLQARFPKLEGIEDQIKRIQTTTTPVVQTSTEEKQ